MKKYYYKKSTGLTLIELMIAITLGMLVISAVSFLLLEVKQSSRQNENFGRMQENARFALRAMSYDLSHAGFYAGMLKGDDIAVDGSAAAIGTDCGTAGDVWLTNLTTPIEYTASQANSPPTDHTCIVAGDDFVANTATLAIRSVGNTSIATDPAAPGTLGIKRTYIRTNGDIGCLWFSGASLPSAPTSISCPTASSDVDDWVLKSTIYYVSNASGTPTLCRKVLAQGSALGMTTECLIEGVERFHIDFGFDQDGDGRAERYSSSSVPNPIDFNEIVTARIYLLIRSPDIASSYTNTKTYDLGPSVTITIPSAANDHYFRRVFSTTVLLRNLVNLRDF